MSLNNQPSQGKLDPITFFYGFGAAIVLIASMFKFVGWEYATELFIVGLAIEAVVFLVSAFERTKSEKEYAWENVFPQLVDKNAASNLPGATTGMPAGVASPDLQQKFDQLGQQVQQMQQSLQAFSGHLDKNAGIASQSMQSMENMNREIEKYNDHLKRLNQKFSELSGR